jgi:hypothetical protein
LHTVLELCLQAPDAQLNKHIAHFSLESLSKLLEWVPLNDTVLSPTLLDICFRFMHLPNNNNSLLACSCINEVLRRNYVPQTSTAGAFLMRVYRELISILQVISVPATMASLEEDYLQKFTQVLNVFVTSQLTRLESAGVQPDEFLAQLYQFTLAQVCLLHRHANLPMHSLAD